MDYNYESWTVKKLIELYEARRLDLNPPYQRNPIWSSVAQRELIQTILKNRPMPNFFILRRADGVLEVVDGKQRALTIFAFWRGHLETFDGQTVDTPSNGTDTPTVRDKFLDYRLNITLITDLGEDEPIEKFYALVNSTGLRLNRPEIRKAEFYTTNLLRLVTNLAGLDQFHRLGLFTRLSARRMNDVDFVSELVAQLQYGITDKKEKVDDLYEKDIDESEFHALRNEFMRVLDCFTVLDSIVLISKTRYRQKNDFYTFFGFLHIHPEIEQPTIDYFYNILVRIGPYIRPSQDRCEPLMTYALNCVTQSNSKKAREDRLSFFESLLVNRTANPNGVQTAILEFFRLSTRSITNVGGCNTIRWEDIRDPDQCELPI